MIPRPPRSSPFPFPAPFRSCAGDPGGRLHTAGRHAVAADRNDAVSDPQRRRVVRRRSEEQTPELQSLTNPVCRLLLEKKKKRKMTPHNINEQKKQLHDT